MVISCSKCRLGNTLRDRVISTENSPWNTCDKCKKRKADTKICELGEKVNKYKTRG